jgi:hypothetical protein
VAERRVSLTKLRFIDLVNAAALRGCACAVPELRTHEGKCISCWALSKRIEHIRSLVSSPLATASPTLARLLTESEEELRFRAEGLPAAERRLAERERKEAEARRG